MIDKKKVIKARIEEAQYLAEESVCLYSESSALRLCILGIPAIGTAIDTILTTRGQSIANKRLLDFFNILDLEVKKLNDKLINFDFVNSEEFFDLLIKISESCIKTRSEEKKEMYAKILSNAIVNTDVKTNPEFYLNVIEELSIEEILLAKEYFEYKVNNKYKEKLEKQNITPGEYLQKFDLIIASFELPIQKEDYDFLFLRLIRVGLLKENRLYNGPRGSVFEVTDTFVKIMSILK